MRKKILSTISPSAIKALLTSSSSESRVIPIDGTWYMPNNPKNGKQQFLNEERIKNAAFFDLDEIALPNSKYPHMLPTFNQFNRSLTDIGIQKSDKLVVYDKSGIFSGPRVAWTLALFGHEKVYLLDNYINYNKFEYPIETKKVDSLTTNVLAGSEYKSISEDQFNENYKNQVIEFDELLDLVKSDKLGDEYITLDARSTDRFTGEAPEPRPGLSSGHIPTAISLPFTKVLNESDKSYKSREELLSLFKEEFGVDFSKPDLNGKKGIIVMCGTGVTAVILRLAIETVIGSKVPIRVYDGSWTEWAQRAPEEFIVKDI